MLLCSNPLFSLGQTVATPNALDLLAQHNILCFSLLARHQSGDWGNVPAEDALSNQEAIERGYRIRGRLRKRKIKHAKPVAAVAMA